MEVSHVIERKDVETYLKKRGLIKQYTKAKNFLLSGFYSAISFKKREPKSDEIYYFRINKQFRAYCYFEGTTVVVFEIDNHQ